MPKSTSESGSGTARLIKFLGHQQTDRNLHHLVLRLRLRAFVNRIAQRRACHAEIALQMRRREIERLTVGNAGNAADTADPDGDGENSLFEYVVGSVPTNPASRFACRIKAVPDLPLRKNILFSPIVAAGPT